MSRQRHKSGGSLNQRKEGEDVSAQSPCARLILDFKAQGGHEIVLTS